MYCDRLLQVYSISLFEHWQCLLHSAYSRVLFLSFMKACFRFPRNIPCRHFNTFFRVLFMLACSLSIVNACYSYTHEFSSSSIYACFFRCTHDFFFSRVMNGCFFSRLLTSIPWCWCPRNFPTAVHWSWPSFPPPPRKGSRNSHLRLLRLSVARWEAAIPAEHQGTDQERIKQWPISHELQLWFSYTLDRCVIIVDAVFWTCLVSRVIQGYSLNGDPKGERKVMYNYGAPKCLWEKYVCLTSADRRWYCGIVRTIL